MPTAKVAKVQQKLMLPSASKGVLRAAAKHYGKSMSEVVEDLIDEVLVPEMQEVAAKSVR